MQSLEISDAVRPLQRSLGVKGLKLLFVSTPSGGFYFFFCFDD